MNPDELRKPLRPLRAPLVLRIGVTGHRPDPTKRASPDVAQLRATAREILRHIADVFAGVATTYGDELFQPCEGQPPKVNGTLRIISALAAGSDQWLAEEAMALGYELQTPLPFRRAEFRNDFKNDAESLHLFDSLLKKATAVLELDGKVDTPGSGERHPDSGSYAAVGNVVLDQSDILVAIWDGEDPSGAGGTGYVVHEALERGIPVVWIRWTEANQWSLLGSKQHVWRKASDEVGDRERLSELVRDLVVPPTSDDSAPEGKDLRASYFSESQKHGNPIVGWWPLFRDILCGDAFTGKRIGELVRGEPFRVADFFASGEKEWNAAWQNTGLQASLVKHIKQSYLPHYAWANGLSIYYANMYRSSFVLTYLLGAAAVCFALLPLIAGKPQVWSGVELGLISLILGITFLGQKRRWHERWIEYRSLAERLRLAQFLAPLGGGGQQVSQPGHLAGYGDPSATWMHWHYRAIERAAGLPIAVVDESYLTAYRFLLCEGLIRRQIRYHAAMKQRFHRLDHRLHWTGVLLFIVTLGVCIIHLYPGSHGHEPNFPENLLVVLAAALPALGAALAGIRSQAEFQRVTRRAAAMEQRLTALEFDLASISNRGDELNSTEIRRCARRVTGLMINEMLDWRVVFQDRPLELPA